MATDKDLKQMIEIITTAIVIHEREEELFRRSARASTSERAKNLFSEIADELHSHVNLLNDKKQKLVDDLSKQEATQKGQR